MYIFYGIEIENVEAFVQRVIDECFVCELFVEYVLYKKIRLVEEGDHEEEDEPSYKLQKLSSGIVTKTELEDIKRQAEVDNEDFEVVCDESKPSKEQISSMVNVIEKIAKRNIIQEFGASNIILTNIRECDGGQLNWILYIQDSLFEIEVGGTGDLFEVDINFDKVGMIYKTQFKPLLRILSLKEKPGIRIWDI